MADRKKMRYRVGSAAFILLMGCLTLSAKAAAAEPAYPYGPSANIWLGVTETPTQARISVTVPLSYGFAVVGSVEASDTGGVSVEAGNLLLSNVRVKVNKPSGALPGPAGESDFSIETEDMAAMIVKNYSTDVREEQIDEAEPVRTGLPVELEPYIVAVAEDTHHWKPSVAVPGAISEDFKKFQMSLNGAAFSEAAVLGSGSDKVDVIKLEQKLALPAPPDVERNGHTAAGTAHVPFVEYLYVTLKVGGYQNQYKQVEESVKVGQIRWRIIPGELK